MELSKKAKIGLAVLIVALLALTVLVAWSQTELNPVRKYVGSDGSLHLQGSVSGAMLDYLLHGPRPGSYLTERVALISDGHPTAAFQVEKLGATGVSGRTSPTLSFDGLVRPISAALGTVADSFVYVLRDFGQRIAGFFTLDARAAGCTSTGSCFWVGGTGAFSNTAHWATTSGGGTTGGLPAATDTVTFDASSGAGTATVDATFTSGAVVMTNSSVSVDGSSHLWKVGGSWSDNTTTDKFVISTSTVEFTATGTITNAGSGGAATFYNLTIDLGATVTDSAGQGVSAVFTVNGSYVINGTTQKSVYILNNTNTADALTFGVSGAITSGANLGGLNFFTHTNAVVDIPGGTYTNTKITLMANNTVAGLGVQFKLLGNLTALSLTFAQRTSAPEYFFSQTFNVNLVFGGACISDSPAAAAKIGLKATSGTWTLDCESGGYAVSITDGTNSANFWVDFGSSTWDIVWGGWRSGVSTDSTDWNVGTSTVVFSGPSATILPPNFSGSMFYNVTFNAGASTSVFTLSTNQFEWGGVLNVTGGAGTTTLATADLTLLGGSLVVGNAGVLTANASSVTVSGVTMTGGASGTITLTSGSWSVTGNWDTSGAGSTLTQGTSGVTLNATGTLKLLAGQTFATLFLNAAGTRTLSSAVTASILTVTTTVLAKGTNALTVNGALTLQTGGAITSTSGDVVVTGAVNISAAASYIAFGSEAWTISGTWTNASTSASWATGTETVTLNDATGGTLTFAGANLAVPEFDNLVLNSTGVTAQTFTMATRGLSVGGTLTLSDAASTTTLDTSASNLAISAVNFVATTGGILKARASTVTVSGNWSDTSTTTWPAWTGTLALTGASAQNVTPVATHLFPTVTMTGAGKKDFKASFGTGNVSLAAASTWKIDAGKTYSIPSGTILTLNGSLDWNGAAGSQIVLSAAGPWTMDTRGQNFTVSYVTVGSSNVSAGFQVFDCVGGVDSGGNNGWLFQGCGIVTGTTDLVNNLPILLGAITALTIGVGFIIVLASGMGRLEHEANRDVRMERGKGKE